MLIFWISTTTAHFLGHIKEVHVAFYVIWITFDYTPITGIHSEVQHTTDLGFDVTYFLIFIIEFNINSLTKILYKYFDMLNKWMQHGCTVRLSRLQT